MKAELRVIAFLQVKEVSTFGLIAACGRKRHKWSTWARVFVPRRRPCKRHNLDFGTMMCDGGAERRRRECEYQYQFDQTFFLAWTFAFRLQNLAVA